MTETVHSERFNGFRVECFARDQFNDTRVTFDFTARVTRECDGQVVAEFPCGSGSSFNEEVQQRFERAFTHTV